ncbi:ABC transporter permease [Rubellicoccus peritrichatus]|uniref:ABC transporter permease subunit n=1 Tax=Rubellicoccus peritrichatus TaxID=3080537 RepID=A0AAQ3QQ25_9BACT|nr:ABC transporter permease subunit [Puniceicoccus sp. CR14]WOO39758.1 ABC transporter permease subunit [Puniceicoccus sp. CR14]
MFRFALTRLAEAIPVIFIIITLTFFMVRLAPGGPFDGDKQMPESVREALDAHYGLDKPLIVQYWNYLVDLVQGDLGPSFNFPGWTVNELIADKIPVSLELGLYSLCIALLVGIIIGVTASIRPNSWSDYIPMSLAMLGICLPTFVVGPILLLIFALDIPVFNVSGWNFPRDRVLPSLTLGLFYAAYIARLTRGSMLEVRNQDYMRTALAKGLPTWRVYLIHGLRNGILPVISYMGPAAAGLISGSFVVETIFHIPGLGRFFVASAINRDYTLVMGTVILYAVLIIGFNLISDLVQARLNPRQRFE